MKKRGILLLALLLAVGLCGCKRKDVVYWEKLPMGEPVNDAEYPELELEEQILIDEDGIKIIVPASTITALHYENSETVYYEIPVRIENNTKKEVSITGSEQILNGYEKSGKENRDTFLGEGCLWFNEEKTPFITFAPAGSVTECKMPVCPEALRYTGDMMMQEIAMTLNSTCDGVVKEHDVKIRTSAYTGEFAKELPIPTFQVEDSILYNENGVCIKVEEKAIEASELFFGGYNYAIPVLVENTTKQHLVLEDDKMFVNGIESYFSVTSREGEEGELDMPAGSVQERYLRLYISDLWKKDIYEIQKIDLSFHCRVLEDEETGHRTKYVDFEAKIPVVE